MPVYEYACTKCKHQFEEKASMSAPRRKRCPKCRCKVEQVYSSVGIAFKGSGWYVTDYKNKTAPKPKEKKVASIKQGPR